MMNEIFQFFENPAYERRSVVHLPSRNSRSKQKLTYQAETHVPSRNSRTESIMNLGAKLRNRVPQNIKASKSLNVFKSKIKYCTPNHYPC